MPVDHRLRMLLERHSNLTVPLGFGDPVETLTVGSILDLGDDDRPVIGHLDQLGLEVPEPDPTGPLDIGLTLSRTVGADATTGIAGGEATVGGQASAVLKVKHGRDLVVVVEPAPGLTIEKHSLGLAARIASDIPTWDHRRWAYVARVFAVAKGSVMIALEGGGEVRLTGAADAVATALGGELTAGVTWSSENMLTKQFDEPGVFGVHVVRVTAKGLPRMV